MGTGCITTLLNRQGWQVSQDRVQRIWRREGLKVPKKQKPKVKLWLNDGSCIRLRPLFAKGGASSNSGNCVIPARRMNGHSNPELDQRHAAKGLEPSTFSLEG